MTLTSHPNDNHVAFVTKISEQPSPFKTKLMHMQPGDLILLDAALGDLVLPKSPDLPLVFVAGGIGIASYVSMLQDLITRKEERPIFLFYALRSAHEQIFRGLLDSYPLQLKEIAIAPNRLTAGQIKSSVPPDALIYLSGSQRFVEGLQIALEQLRTPRGQIVFDYYDGYTDL